MLPIIVYLLVVVLLILVLRWGFIASPVDEPEAQSCRHCGYDLLGGLLRCPKCGKSASPENYEQNAAPFDDMFLITPLEPRTPEIEEKLVLICQLSSMVEAAFLIGLLENHGIAPVREGQPVPTDYQPVAMRLMVWSNDAEPAAALVAEVRRRQAARLGIEAAQ